MIRRSCPGAEAGVLSPPVRVCPQPRTIPDGRRSCCHALRRVVPPGTHHRRPAGQICGLKWSDVDLNNQLITVHDNRVVVANRALDKAGGKPSMPTRPSRSTEPLWQQHYAGGALGRTASASSSAATTSPGTTSSPTKMAVPHPRQHPATLHPTRQRRGAAADHLPRPSALLRHHRATRRRQPQGGQRTHRPLRCRVFPADLCTRVARRRPRGRRGGRGVRARG